MDRLTFEKVEGIGDKKVGDKCKLVVTGRVVEIGEREELPVELKEKKEKKSPKKVFYTVEVNNVRYVGKSGNEDEDEENRPVKKAFREAEEELGEYKEE